MNAVVCHPSIARRLARWLSAIMLIGLGLVSAVIYSATAVRLQTVQQETLHQKEQVLSRFVAAACESGEAGLLQGLALFEPARGGTRLELRRGDDSMLFTDRSEAFRHKVSTRFDVPAPRVEGGVVRALLTMDVAHDTHMLQGLAVTLLLTSLLGAAGSGLAIRWLVRREMEPLQLLAGQTRAISPQRLDQRLALDCPAEELMPWVEQFNALMDRLEQAYAQLEGFNADVAHELRTPLANLIGETELALSRDRSCDSLRETMASNLEEMQRMSALVNDMLFLSNADRGAVARVGVPISLAELAAQVIEFHEAPLEEAGVQVRVEGDALAAVDEPLIKRALSNLLGNAVRYAEAGSTIVIELGGDADAPGQTRIAVRNQGLPIEPAQLPRLFDRFFRGDASRCSEGQPHHGLGLAIVAAIARMHGGRTLAASEDGTTRIGLTLAVPLTGKAQRA